MEAHQAEIPMMAGGGAGGSRWNPMKEQTELLEGLYKEGLRTPNAEQINKITGRLREFGHMEGKNVFYWFQNHKARQRQMQKQKQTKNEAAISYSNRFILPKPTYHQPQHFPAGVCMPYRPEIGLYNQQQQPRLLPPPMPIRRRPPPLFPAPVAGGPPGRFIPPYSGQGNYYYSNNGLIFSPGKGIEENKETLELFPMKPSGNLLSPNSSSSSSFPAGGIRIADHQRQIQGFPAAGDGGGGDRAYFDFLCGGNGSSSRDRY